MRRCKAYSIIVFMMMVALLPGCKSKHRFIKKTQFKGDNVIQITFAAPVNEKWAKDASNFTVHEKRDPDILLHIQKTIISRDHTVLSIYFKNLLDTHQTYIVKLRDIMSTVAEQPLGTETIPVKKSYFGYLLSILIGAMLVQNFVFTKYLGLCVFFGTSGKKSTAVGMGITFTVTIVVASLMSWFFYQFILKPFHLDYLQIIVFIGMVSLSVQGVDTILRKVNPALFKAFGVYLVLVIANCIILAVPLMIANNEYNIAESFMLALGAGLGFLIALFLMSSVREGLELANVPVSFRGLPIAFVVAGLFALSFMGFSGMSIF